MKALYSILLVVVMLVSNTTPAKAQMIYPNSTNVVWYPGDTITITWNPASVFGSTAFIYLKAAENGPHGSFPQAHNNVTIDSYAPNTGSYTWTVPQDYTTEDRSYRIEITSSAPYERLTSPNFQVRFGRTRLVKQPKLQIEQTIYLSWQGMYHHTYDVQSSIDGGKTWTSLGTIFAEDENIGVTVSITSATELFRLKDITEPPDMRP